MHKIKVLILFGGCSPEHDVSLKSAFAAISNADKEKYEIIPLGITMEGKWLRYYGNTENIQNGSWSLDINNCVPAIISPDKEVHGITEFYKNGKIRNTYIDVAFPVMHGKNGEDGTVQGLIELSGIPIAGCGVLASALCMDKDRAHKIANEAGIKVPLSQVFARGVTEKELTDETCHMKYPIFVKPVNAGSSFGISKVFGREQLWGAANKAFLYDDHIIIEENVEGFEVGCAVMGNEILTVGEIDEVELSNDFFDYTEKYTPRASKVHMPARISKSTSERLKTAAKHIYKALGCQGYARVDMFLTPDEEIVFNEVNTIPGFTEHSRFPNMMKGIGLDFTQIIDEIIRLGLEK